MKSLRTVLADHEHTSRARLRHLLTHTPGVELIAECEDVLATLEAVQGHAPDLLLLDIQMSGLNGPAMAALLSRRCPPAVIFTASRTHEAGAFGIEPADFLVKPITGPRFWRALARARRRCAESFWAAEHEIAVPVPPVHRVAVREENASRYIEAEEIDWVEACGNYAILHTGAGTHLLRETMSGLESQLPEERFLRISRSAIVNLARIREISAVSSHQHAAVLMDGTRLPVTCTVRELLAHMRVL